ncbi:phytoene desaturase family protein [Nitratireductor alexandrii]|uniref:phytoene desaturase family protein n=1 Tax=Nitratireductor alexandrii TaxID=2448161 RepID=UPI000FD7AFC8|nr:NAD(P)/FAD-dependent oxidoreductase [Nitratireductor alexandrii]
MSSQFDAIIVGAGHNGMVAAHYLARAGLKVLILEMRHVTGGLVVTDELFPGFRGNVATNAAHSLAPQVVDDMKLYEHGLTMVPVEPSSATLFTGGRRIVNWSDREAFRREVAVFSARDYEAYVALLDEVSALAKLLNVSFFETPPGYDELIDRVRSSGREEFFSKVMFGSIGDLAREYFESEEMRSSIGLVSVVGAASGPSAAGTAYPLIHRALERGARIARDGLARGLSEETASTPWSKTVPVGGMGAIAEAMERSIRAAGVEIVTEAKVAQVLCRDGRARGVVLADGREFGASTVISNLHPAKTMLELVPDSELPPGYCDGIGGDITDGCMSKVYVALDGKPRFKAARNEAENDLLMKAGFRTAISLAEADQSAAQAAGGHWHARPVIYGVIPSAVDPTLTPPGKHILSLSVSGSPYRLKDGWDGRREAWTKHVLRELAEYIDNLDDVLLEASCRTPQDLEDEFGLFHGDITHGRLSSRRLFGWGAIAGRSDYTTPIAGLYLCGVGTWPSNYCSGIPGRNAAMKVISANANGREVRKQLGESPIQ